MGLTSKKLEFLVAASALAAFVLAVWLWPRLGRRNWRSVLGRVGVLVGTQILTLSAIGLFANTYFGFYGSWGDLFGTDQGGAQITPGVTAASGTGPGGSGGPGWVRVRSSRAVPLMLGGSSQGGTGGTLQTVEIHGGTSGITSPAYVYLPPQYGQRGYLHRRFPVAVVLTGYPGTASNLVTRMKYPTVVAQAIQEHQMQPTVLVLLRPTVAPPRDTECQDVVNGPQTETFFTEDLHRALAGSYRVGTTGASWGAIGDSTGGYCALKFAMRHPGAYSAAVSLSGYYSSAVDMTTGDLFGGSKRLREENDLLWRLRHLPVPKVSLLVTSSLHGEYDYPATLRFISAVRPPMTIDKLILPSGGHNFTTWNRELPQAMRWLGGRLTVPAGPPGSA
ncbi:alpha/beta hydrolase [Phaeacidiphilus oryzae]|uniref:alpha/beta hydrolase n=1 Tax=Phaeacidiphilus oryzae TaxID=348818 RepID=UPI00055D4928|nr:alpha/beta hydrolase-fold protein [Phaeacidiphilus oryzae]